MQARDYKAATKRKEEKSSPFHFTFDHLLPAIGGKKMGNRNVRDPLSLPLFGEKGRRKRKKFPCISTGGFFEKKGGHHRITFFLTLGTKEKKKKYFG